MKKDDLMEIISWAGRSALPKTLASGFVGRNILLLVPDYESY